MNKIDNPTPYHRPFIIDEDGYSINGIFSVEEEDGPELCIGCDIVPESGNERLLSISVFDHTEDDKLGVEREYKNFLMACSVDREAAVFLVQQIIETMGIIPEEIFDLD